MSWGSHSREWAHAGPRVARARGLCASRGCPGDPPRGVSEANDAEGGEGAASARPRTGDRTRAFVSSVLLLALRGSEDIAEEEFGGDGAESARHRTHGGSDRGHALDVDIADDPLRP